MSKEKKMYEELVDDILELDHDIVEDYWKNKGEIPLFCKEPPSSYEEQIPDEDVITMKIDTRNAQERNPMNALICASTGVGKTRLIKNIIKGYHKQGYRILIFEPKSVEMMNGSKIGRGRYLHRLDKNERLPISAYCPNYIKNYLSINFPSMLKKVKFYSASIDKLNYPEIWQSFGVPVKPASLIIEMIEKGHKDINFIYKQISGMSMHAMTRQAAISSLDSIKATNFFGTKKVLPLAEEWEKGNIVSIEYFSRDGSLLNTDIGLVLDLVRDIGLQESHGGLKNVTKKLLVFDDAFYYAGMSASMATKFSGGINLAIRNIGNCQNNFRTWGIDTIFTVQSPDSNAIYPALIDGCTTKLISYVENPSALSNKIPYAAFSLLNPDKPGSSSLYVDEANYIYQWIYVKGKTRFQTGFPWDCSVGHS